MSCKLSLIANICDIKGLKKYLYPDFIDVSVKETDFEGWDDSDWGWHDESEVKDEEEQTTHSWLQDCYVSISPTSDLLAVAKTDKLVLLAQKWDSSEDDVQMKFSPAFQGSLKQEEGEEITSVLCLPLASQKRSTQGGPDWTCVIVGFSSGYVRMYTENGTLLLSQIFSEKPVRCLKARTYEPPRHMYDAEKHEELNILYTRSLVTIDGFSLVQCLRACRNQVARAAASGSDAMQPPPLAYKKYALVDQSIVSDQMACGMITPNPFDQMQTGSLLGGHKASIRNTPPASHLYLTTGTEPYMGFYYVVEGSTQPMLSDVAHAVASKLKSALFSQISAASGWFGLGGAKEETSKERKKPKIEPATSLSSRFGLHDKRREGGSIVVSPDNHLAATTDSFGRVMLIDIARGIAVRMWKGYRDAQVGWVEVAEDLHEPKDDRTVARHAMFLVIYAARRGIVEVWSAQQGPRVAAFNVSKSCLLLSPTHGLMGLNNVTYKDVKIHLGHIYLLDPEGTVKVIDVPFHLALSDKNSKRARDMHLLKKLKMLLKENTTEGGGLQTEVTSTILDMKFAGIRQQALERVLHTKYLSVAFMQTVIRAILQQIQIQGQSVEGDENMEAPEDTIDLLDYETKMLQQFCKSQQHMLKTYSSLNSLHEEEPMDVDAEGDIMEKLRKLLSLTNGDTDQIWVEIERYQATLREEPKSVHFEGDNTMTVVDFLACFECQKAEDKREARFSVHLHPGLSEARTSRLAKFIFEGALAHGTSAEYNALLAESHILPENLMSLLLHLWLTNDRHQISSLVTLYGIVKSVSSLKDQSGVTVGTNIESPWWHKVRDVCSESDKISAALMAALVGRSVAKEMALGSACENEMTDSGTQIDLSEWETLTIDMTQWTVLVKQLEDLLALKCLLKMSPSTETLGQITAVREIEPIRVSVKKVLDGGRGVLPEFVAKWIAGQGIAPAMLCLSEEPESSQSEEKDDNSDEKKVKRSDSVNPIISQLQSIQQRLPHSLDSDILMANCAWEYMVLWNKDLESLFPLEQALSYLRCIQNALLQHGVAAMMWQMFVVKKFSAATLLIDKVGKAPKDRLCRRDVGLGELGLEKFMGLAVDILDTLIQAKEDSHEVPVLNVEDLWQNVQGPTSLVELAIEQKATNKALVQHHFHLCVILHAILAFSLKSVKPLGLFDSKGRNAFFKPLQSSHVLPGPITEESIISSRRQFFCRVINESVISLGERDKILSSSGSSTSTPPVSPKLATSPSTSYTLPTGARNPKYSRWPPLMVRISKPLCVDPDVIRRQHACQLYASGLDKMAEEVLLTVNDHPVVGSQLLLLAGQRLRYFVMECDPADSVERVSRCSPALSTWLKSMDSSHLRCFNPPLSDTAGLIGQVINQLPEGHSEYNLAIEMVEFVQGYL